MKKLILVLCVGSFTFAACNREKTNTENTNADAAVTNNASTTAANAGEADYEAEYRDRATRMSARMATDMQFDTATQSRVNQTYYNRARRVSELQRKYNYSTQGNSQNGGSSTGTFDKVGYENDMRALDVEIDNEFRSYLAPEQYKMYETNRSTYWTDEAESGSAVDNTQRNVTVDGDEITVETGDIKVKAKPGESKVETSTYESKIEGNERKFKSKVDGTKIKSEPGKTKYESGDTKIKVKERD